MIRNAKITGTSLGDDGRGPSFWVHVDYGDSVGQGFGGYALGGTFTHYILMGILNTIEVDKWENLKGTSIRVKGDSGKIESIGHYLKDKWFTPSEFNSKCDHVFVSDRLTSGSYCKHCSEEA